MFCLNCQAPTNNPKFCSRSCSASCNNKISPKRSPEGNCPCGSRITSGKKYCSKECSSKYKKKKEYVFNDLQTCGICKNTYPRTLEFFYKHHNRTHTYCKTCLNKQYAKKQRDMKQQCVDYMGGKCQHCGYNRFLSALEFHHKDPSEKDFSLAAQIRRNKKFDYLKNELDKCILLCANCHREEHSRISGIPG